MNTSVLFSLVLMLLSVGVYYLFDRDMFSVPGLFCYAFTISSFASLYNCIRWHVSLSWNAALLLIAGIVTFIVGSYITYRLCRLRWGDSAKQGVGVTIISCRSWSSWVMCIFGAVIVFFYCRAVIRIVQQIPHADISSWSSIMAAYRQYSAYNVHKPYGAVPTAVVYAGYVLTAVAYVYLFVIINNLVAERRMTWIAVLPVLIYVVYILVQSSRGPLIVFAIAGFIMWWVLFRRKNSSARLSGKSLAAIVGLIAVGLAGFVALSGLVGRKLSKTPFDNLMMYVGGSITNFSSYLDHPVSTSPSSKLWGGETFYALYSFLGRRSHNPNWLYSYQLEYTFAKDGISMGNVYTAFRYYLHDFGFIGMFLFTAVQAVLFTWLYYVVVSRLRQTNIALSASVQIIVAYLLVSVVYFPIADWLFHQYLAPATFVTLVFMVVMSVLLIRYRKPAVACCLSKSG
ncbi:O-antigen polymerase [Bifidobacterium sp. ESL0704]|uniref:O-antigen polymerase n=1 Tax=Bifidobacterium sp. ESL0704 TaxID=2983219 RepID=UPI0023F9BC24|nr:O-antigen polymerase [Bifidobacterium sp. ESL0704]WEV52727.1 O-antigen ligase [Bifidobacterium sp. ESL0704]